MIVRNFYFNHIFFFIAKFSLRVPERLAAVVAQRLFVNFTRFV